MKTKIKTQNFHESSANPQRINHPKKRRCISKDVKTEETLSSQDQKLVETTNLWRQFFSDKKSPQLKFASATIAKSVESMNGATMNTSRFLH